MTRADRLLGARYRLVRRIAVGGMGEVWEAYDETLTRPVAIKVLREEFAGDEGFLARLRTEARNSAALGHPNIAQLFDYGESNGSGYLVMELVVGEPLSDLLEREPVLPTRRLLPILAQTARGLHAAHEAGVVHRDVKPGNILLGQGGRVKITDFGVSRARDQAVLTATGMVMGTAQYLSPEQAIGKAATPLSDLYSLGIIAYEALAGHRPFTGPTAVDIAVAHVNEQVPPLPAAVDAGLAALVLRLLDKEPARRPASGDALAALLDQLVPRTPPSGVPALAAAPATAVPATTAPATPAPATPTGAAPTRTLPPSIPPAGRPPRPDTPTGTPATRRTAAHRTAAARAPQTGHRSGRISWPLVALVLLLVGLLGAWLADVLARSGDDDGASQLVSGASRTSGYPLGGMIANDGSHEDVADPTTRTKDA